ncbi:MAG: hypothetical protein EOO24_61845 [Comamonadaceae bacterium]|nr:MAG: hypothetical protein EOO24_61845 [Comamonadaceae bacterium]
MAGILAKRAQLQLAVPGHFNEAADGAALRRRALRLEVARRAGVPVAAGEEPGPLDAADRAVRVALRELFTQRFGKPELDKEMAAAEQAAAGPAPAASGAVSASGSGKPLPAWQRVGKWVQGEPQVVDGARFYAALQRRLEDAQDMPAGAVQQLGNQRAAAIVEALVGGGVAADRAKATAAASGEGNARAVEVKLELSAR